MSESPSKDFAHVVELSWRQGTYFAQTQEIRRLTDLDATIDLGSGPLALSDPKLEFTFKARTAGPEEDNTSFRMGINDGFALNIVKGYAHQPITARILRFEYDSALGYGAKTSPTYLMEYGKVINAKLNPGGQDDVVEFTIRTCKNELEAASGRILTPQCDLTFGDPKTCGVDLSPRVKPGMITAVNGSVGLTIEEVVAGDIIGKPNFYWTTGSVWVNGLEIRIKDWDGNDQFQLSQLPPEDWAGLLPLACEVIPGCRKSVFDCRVHGNEDRYSGLGIGTPDRNPIFERGGAG